MGQARQSAGRDLTYDLAIIGGGVNGCGIARDAVGRGLSVFLCEQGDLAQGTSSASTKLFHGGLRYLEHYEFRLVREALIEREVLLRAMPHISWPLRFVLPHHKGLRPAWLLRLGLFIYDHLGGQKILPGTRGVDLTRDAVGAPLQSEFKKGFEYSDCWVQDSRLVVLNARDAAARGAEIAVGTRCISAEREGEYWKLTLEEAGSGAKWDIAARALVNAGGPWVEKIIRQTAHLNTSDRIRLVRGSHIVVRKLYDHDRAYIFQQSDGRIVFAIPYEDDFLLIGTTDCEHEGDPAKAVCTPDEVDYLRKAVSGYFNTPIEAEDIVWTYSGVRPLFDDGAKSATAATRDYVLKVEHGSGQAPLLNIFGGKITTYRRLAEAALAKLAPFFPEMAGDWTANAALPGGDFPVDGIEGLSANLRSRYPFLDDTWARRLARLYGTEAVEVLGDAQTEADLGRNFGANLTEAELTWLIEKEWARTAEDVLWRRTKLGLRLGKDEAAALDEWMRKKSSAATSGRVVMPAERD